VSERPHNGHPICPCCQRKAVEHQHSLTKVLANAIWEFAKKSRGRPLELREMEWQRTRWQNFTKLKYWGLIGQETPKSGTWHLRKDGQLFVCGQLAIHKAVWTWDDEPVEFVGPKLFLADVWADMPLYHDRLDFAAVERPHLVGAGIQKELF